MLRTTYPATLEIDRYFEGSLFAMVLTAFVALAGTGRLDPLSMIVVLAALGLRGFLFAIRRAVSLSTQTTSRLTVAYLFFYIADLFVLSRSFITTLVHMVLFILVVKLFSVQRERDNVYLAVIAFMMILAAAVLTVDSFFLGALFLFLLLSASTFISMEMRRSLRETSRAGGDNAAPSRSVAKMPTGHSEAFARSLSTTATVLVLASFALTPLLFYAVPRWSFGRLSSIAARNNFASGFSDSVRLGEIGRIQQNDVTVMHVSFDEGNEVPPNLLFRALSLSTFDGKRWFNQTNSRIKNADDVRILGSLRDSNVAFAGTSALQRATNGELGYRVLLEPIGVNYFFFVPTPTSLNADEPDYVLDARGGAISYFNPRRQIRSYRATSLHRQLQNSLTALIGSDISEDSQRYYLQLPKERDARIQSLSRQITQQATTAADKAAALESYLQTNFGYTLQMESEGSDPLAHFLFTRKKGHCEYFASAMAVMLREIGIPARVVNGFRGGEFNDVSGSYIIRARDAHAWVEAFIPGFGWATFDPTPPGVAPVATPWSRLLLYVDAMREFWSEWVINYDSQRQRDLGETSANKTREAFDAVRIWIRDTYDELINDMRRTQTEVFREPKRRGWQILSAVLLIAALSSLPRLLRRIRIARISRQPGKAPQHAAAIWYERLIHRLSSWGLTKAPSIPPTEFAENLPNDISHLKSKVTEFTLHYQRARFGNSADDAMKLPDLYEEVEEALKK